jgi:broad specificity phosphatase PhoE
MQIFIVRHGQTDRNKDDLIAGQSDVKLTDRRRLQAALLSKRLAKIGREIDRFFVSS